MPPLARAAGVLLVLAGLVGAVAVFPTYLVVGGTAVGTGDRARRRALVALLARSPSWRWASACCGPGARSSGWPTPAVAGALAVGQLLIELYRGTARPTRPAVEVIAGERVVTSRRHRRRAGCSGSSRSALAVLAGAVAMVAWGRTVMEDGGALDPVRPVLAGGAVRARGRRPCCAWPSPRPTSRTRWSPTRPRGWRRSSPRGAAGAAERPGLALLGGLLLAGPCCCARSSRRRCGPGSPPSAACSGSPVFLLSTALTGLRDAVHGPDLDWTLPGVGLLVLGVGAAALTVLAWRWRKPLSGRDV